MTIVIIVIVLVDSLNSTTNTMTIVIIVIVLVVEFIISMTHSHYSHCISSRTGDCHVSFMRRSPRLSRVIHAEISETVTCHSCGDTLISIMTVFFFLEKKNSSSDSGAKAHWFGLCSQRSVSILFFFVLEKKNNHYGNQSKQANMPGKLKQTIMFQKTKNYFNMLAMWKHITTKKSSLDNFPVDE
jgi:hypothetical protein